MIGFEDVFWDWRRIWEADTTAAICAQVAGAHYGMTGIPEGWRSKLTMRQEITTLADRLHEVACI